MEEQSVRTAEVVVIGAGPGGYVAAIRAAQLGKKVILVEQSEIGGVCLNRGCIPSKALISAAHKYNELFHLQTMGIEVEQIAVKFDQTQRWKQQLVQQLVEGIQKILKAKKVEVIHGQAQFVSPTQIRIQADSRTEDVTFEQAIVATGSLPIEIPGMEFGGRVISSTEALAMTELPATMVIVGGGYIGIELGQMFAKFGVKISVLEGSDGILPGFDARTISLVKRNLKKAQVDVMTGAMVKGVEQTESDVKVTYSIDGSEQTISAEYVLFTVGRKPNTRSLGLQHAGVVCDQRGFIEIDDQCRTSVDNIFAIGDVTLGPALAHKASYQGKIAAEVIAGQTAAVNYQAIPLVVFSDPEIATVGLTEKQAKEQGYEIVAGKFAYGASGKALATGAGEGSVTLVADKQTGKLLGAQIIGIEASNLIAECALAIEAGLGLEHLAMTIHAHPTLSEIVMEAAEVAMGQGVHSL